MEELVTKIRTRKGLKVCKIYMFFFGREYELNCAQPEIPPLDTYYDKL